MTDVPDPKTWATGGDPMTSKQKTLIETLAAEKGAAVDVDSLDKGSASMKIEELKKESGSGTGNAGGANSNSSANVSDTPATKLTESSDPSTEKQQRYLAVLEDGNKDSEDASLSKAEASEKIAKLKADHE